MDAIADTDASADLHAGRRSLRRDAINFLLSPEIAPGVVQAFELAAVLVLGFVSLTVYGTLERPELSEARFLVFVFPLTYLYLCGWGGLSDLESIMRPMRNIDRSIVSYMTAAFIVLAFVFGLRSEYLFSNSWLQIWFAAGLAATITIRLLAYWILTTLSRRKVMGRNTVILGYGEQAKHFADSITRDTPFFMNFCGIYGVTPEDRQVEPALTAGGVDDLLREARRGAVDEVIVAMPWSANQQVIDVIERLKELPVNVYLGSELIGFDLSLERLVGPFDRLSMFQVTRRPISGWRSVPKFLLDYTLAALGLLLLSPLLLAIAAAIKLDSPGPVFFMQKRLGFNNQLFYIFKFRSMYHREIPEERVVQAQRGDPRVTRIGRFIRATSIDELPQLLNVLNGTMSIVGPRPHAVSHNEEYGRRIRGYFARHNVKPGITGWAQVRGFRGETTDIELMRKRIEHDVYYVENWSIFFDIKVIVMTCLVVLFQRTAY